ncbi:MAG TPA: PAS domain S-box protein [Pyrinomonadaceae bacterium]|jgi:PAS domain S-box-containing protein
MTSKKGGAEMTLKAANDLTTFAWNVLEKLYTLFTKLWPPVQLFLALVGLALAMFFGKELLHSLLSSQSGISRALEAKLEPSRNADQGITAFLLSNVKDEWTNPDLLNVKELDSILREVDTKVQDVSKANIVTEGELSDRSPLVSEMIDKLGLKVVNSGTTAPWQSAITSMKSERFMMVPATSLRRKTLNEPPLKPDDKPQLEVTLTHNPEILFDLHLASEIEPIMRKMDGASGKLLTIVQTYFITESGVFLIRASGVKDHGRYYGTEFQTYTQYMDRPYFWEAVAGKQRKVTPFDYGSKPYIDLGGNGFVVTFSKKFNLPNQRAGVLCVDAKLPDYVTDDIEQYMKSLGAKVSDFYWSEDRSIEPGKDGPLPSSFSWFAVQLNKSREARSQVLGNIATEPVKATPSNPQGQANSTVRFTVPVTSTEAGPGMKRTKLLWVEFDSNSILTTLTWNLVFFTVGIVIVIAVTGSLFRNYTVLKREMSNVLEKMSKVMRDASTPFVWLDEKNGFVDVNNRMLKLLGYDNIEELRMHSATFRGLITAQTQQTYDDILTTSGAGRETGEYEINVVTKSGEVLHVRAHGERIPYPTFWRSGLPHRFGIFVEVTELTSATRPNQVTEKRDLESVPNPTLKEVPTDERAA